MFEGHSGRRQLTSKRAVIQIWGARTLVLCFTSLAPYFWPWWDRQDGCPTNRANLESSLTVFNQRMPFQEASPPLRDGRNPYKLALLLLNSRGRMGWQFLFFIRHGISLQSRNSRSCLHLPAMRTGTDDRLDRTNLRSDGRTRFEVIQLPIRLH